MCIQTILRVKECKQNSAIMSDGRTVRLGTLTGIVIGDYLSVYADIAVDKIEKKDIRKGASS